MMDTEEAKYNLMRYALMNIPNTKSCEIMQVLKALCGQKSWRVLEGRDGAKDVPLVKETFHAFVTS